VPWNRVDNLCCACLPETKTTAIEVGDDVAHCHGPKYSLAYRKLYVPAVTLIVNYLRLYDKVEEVML